MTAIPRPAYILVPSRKAVGTGWIRTLMILLLAAIIVLVTSSGCASKPKAGPPPVASIHWQDLAHGDFQSAEQGYQRLTPEGTHGLFPATIAVCRIAAVGADSNERALIMAMHPPHDVLTWNSVFDALRDVGEAFPIIEVDLGGHPATLDRVIWAADELNADLLVLYGTHHSVSHTEAEVLGVIYDVRDGTLLASIHAGAAVPDPECVEPPLMHVEGDNSYRDPAYLAQRQFEAHTVACVLDLIRHDQPAARTLPEGWTAPPDREQIEWIGPMPGPDERE